MVYKLAFKGGGIQQLIMVVMGSRVSEGGWWYVMRYVGGHAIVRPGRLPHVSQSWLNQSKSTAEMYVHTSAKTPFQPTVFSVFWRERSEGEDAEEEGIPREESDL